jgi:hypothetical protein
VKGFLINGTFRCEKHKVLLEGEPTWWSTNAMEGKWAIDFDELSCPKDPGFPQGDRTCGVTEGEWTVELKLEA